jgi:Lrp/AsnC family transcriptional regulator, leucine-responsive regulatory protein
MTDQPDLTAADLAILRLVQRDTRLTLEAIADAAGLSVSAAQRRLQRLRDLKVITAEIAVVDPRRVGRAMTFLVELELERDRPELLPALRAWIDRADEVQQAWCITGRADCLMVVTAAGVEEFDLLMERLMEANRNVRKFTTSLALKTMKRGLALAV